MNELSKPLIQTGFLAADKIVLTELNDRFIKSVAQADLAGLDEVLSPDFRYLDGSSGEMMDRDAYDRLIPVPGRYKKLEFDELVIHLFSGDCAMVGARTHAIRRVEGKWTEGYARYLDIYQKRQGRWSCTLACVWHL